MSNGVPAAQSTGASRLTMAFGVGVFAAITVLAIAVERLADPALAPGKGGGLAAAVVINLFVAVLAMLPYSLRLVLFVGGGSRRSARAQVIASFMLGAAVVPATAALQLALGLVGQGLFPAIAAALALSLLASVLLARWR